MLRRIRARRPSHTTIVAYLALFIAVGGGSAFAVVAANQVNSRSIVDGQVKARDLGANSVGPAKVVDKSLTGSELAPNSIAGSRISDNSITGFDVNEASLNLTRGIDYKAAAPDDGNSLYVPILNFGGLLLKARCKDTQAGAGILAATDVRADAAQGTASLYRWRNAGSPTLAFTETLGPGSDEELFPGGLGFGTGFVVFDATGRGDMSSGTGGVGGAKVSITFSSFTSPGFAPCSFSGLATKSP